MDFKYKFHGRNRSELFYVSATLRHYNYGMERT